MPGVTWGTWLVTIWSIYSCVCNLHCCFVQQVPKTWVPISLRGDLLLCTSLLALWQSIVRHFYLNLQENPRKMLLLRLLETSMEKKEDPLFFSWSFNTLRKLYFEDVWCTRHCFQLWPYRHETHSRCFSLRIQPSILASRDVSQKRRLRFWTNKLWGVS